MEASFRMKLTFIRLLFLSFIVAAGFACSDHEFREGVCYDFFSHLGDAKVTVKGNVVNPLGFNGGTQPWTEDEHLFCQIHSRMIMRFKNIPIAKNGVFKFGYGISPAMQKKGTLPRNGKLRLQIEFITKNASVDLFNEIVDSTSFDSGDFIYEEIKLPDTDCTEGDFTIRTDLTSDLVPYQPVLISPVLLTDGRVALQEEVTSKCSKEISLILDAPAGPIEKADNVKPFRADFDEDTKLFTPKKDGRLLVSCPPATASFKVKGDKKCKITFGIAASSMEVSKTADIIFEVSIDGEERFKDCIFSRHDGYWRTRISIPIDFSNKNEVTVEFKTSFKAGRPDDKHVAVWINPVVEREYLVKKQPSGKGKNIILMVVDALRADHLSVYGYERSTTPNLSLMSENAVIFENALAQSSWTIPSTATIFTGQYAYTHGLYDAFHWCLIPGIDTFTEHLLLSGWTTSAFVANKLISDDNNFTKGFESFLEIPYSSAAQLNRAFLNWVDNNSDKRFFSYIHYMDPHKPYAAPGDYFNYFNKQINKPDQPFLLSEVFIDELSGFMKSLDHPASYEKDMNDDLKNLINQLVDLYDSEILYWDEMLASLSKELKTRGLLDDTIIIITSDHGEEFMEHGFLEHGQSLHRELLHVPLIFINTDQPSGRREKMVGLIDFAPTLLGLADLAPDKRTGGPDFAGIDLFNNSNSHEFLFGQTAHGLYKLGEDMTVKQAVFSEKIKGVISLYNDEFDLFDLMSDPMEMTDISSTEKVKSEKLRSMISEWVKKCRSSAPYNISAFDESAFKKLKSMGYIR